MINLITNKAFIERCVEFEEEPLAAVEVGEASSPPEPQEVSKEFFDMPILIFLMDMSLLIIVQMQVFRCNILSLTHHNKMVLLRGRTDH